MLPRKSQLAPLTEIMPIKRKDKWTKVEQDDFNKVKWIMARSTLITNPDFNETFTIHIDASALQLGEVIRQK